jgi:hypothetical protein
MPAPALGNAVLIGFGREAFEGIRNDAATLVYPRPILPINGQFAFASAVGGEVNQSGYVEQGVPGAVTGAIDFGARMSVPVLFEFVRHFFRDIDKTEPDTDVFQYVCTPDRTIAEETLFAIFGFPPVDQYIAHGIKLGQIAATIGNNTAIAARVQGQAMHFTRMGMAVAAGGNTGTWAFKPVLRGPIASAAAGNLFLEVTGLAPLQFKLKQAAGTTPPVIAGTTELTQLYDEDGNAMFIVALEDDGSELGIYAENKDPLMVCVPGTATQHADIDVGDVYYFEAPLEWDLPTPTYLGGQRFTSAHQRNYYSVDEGSTWVEFNTLTTQLVLSWPISLDQGSGSRYPFAIDRTGLLAPTMQLTNKYRSNVMRNLYERHETLALRTYFEGQLLEGGPLRESILIDWTRCQIASISAPPANDQAIVETVNLQGITDDAASPPMTITFITDQDYTVA